MDSSQKAWVQILVPSLTSYETLAKSLNFCMYLSFLNRRMDNNRTCTHWTISETEGKNQFLKTVRTQ